MFSGQFPFKIPDKFRTNSGQKPDKNWFRTNSERWKMNSFWNNFWTFSFRNLSRICPDNFPAIFRTFSGHLFFIGPGKKSVFYFANCSCTSIWILYICHRICISCFIFLPSWYVVNTSKTTCRRFWIFLKF